MQPAEGSKAGSSSTCAGTSQPSAEAVAELQRRFQEHVALAQAVRKRHYWLSALPFVHPFCDLQHVAGLIAEKNPDDFNWAVSFDPDFIAELMSLGFLPMAHSLGRNQFILLPKLHTTRCLLELKDMHVPKSVRKKARNFELSMDTAFDEVCRGIDQQHGESWFYPPIVEAFKALQQRGATGALGGKVFVHSFELWHGDDLVAGEVGYVVGTSYTALSGFKRMPSSGSVQMAATGSFLEAQGLTLWDLGMLLDYKAHLGAKGVPREDFLKRLRQCQAGAAPGHLTLARTPANQLIDVFVQRRRETSVGDIANDKNTGATSNAVMNSTASDSPSLPERESYSQLPQGHLPPNPLSKRQAKKRAKREKALEKKRRNLNQEREKNKGDANATESNSVASDPSPAAHATASASEDSILPLSCAPPSHLP